MIWDLCGYFWTINKEIQGMLKKNIDKRVSNKEFNKCKSLIKVFFNQIYIKIIIILDDIFDYFTGKQEFSANIDLDIK